MPMDVIRRLLFSQNRKSIKNYHSKWSVRIWRAETEIDSDPMSKFFPLNEKVSKTGVSEPLQNETSD